MSLSVPNYAWVLWSSRLAAGVWSGVCVFACLCLCVCKQSLDVLIGQPCLCANPLMAHPSSWSDRSSYTTPTCYCVTSAAGRPVPRQLDQLIITGQNEAPHEEYEVVVTLKNTIRYSKPWNSDRQVREELNIFFLSDLLVLQTEIWYPNDQRRVTTQRAE